MDIFTLLFFLLGISFISFMQLIAERVPNKKTILGRSECDNCHHQLRFIDVLPLIGYVANAGKCHFCKTKVSIKYPLTELLGGILFALSYHLVGLTLDLIVACVMILVLITESISDMNHRIVIDRVWIIGGIILIPIRIIQGCFLEHLLSAGVLFAFLWIVAILASRIMKKDALGYGDVKLYAFIGFVLTIWNNVLSLFLACVLALVFALIFKKYKNNIPLVPFIALATLICFFFGSQMIDWYLGIFGM